MAGSGIIYTVRRKLQSVAAKIIPVYFLNSVYTRVICGYKPNLSKPQTFNEKVQWLKINYFPYDEKVIRMTDKVEVHNLISSMGMKEILPKILHVSTSEKEIPWKVLPDKFVIKCNHGCAYNIICSEKASFSIAKAEKKLRKWLKEDFGLFNLEPHYSKIQRRILIEEHLGECLIDYKFFCFNGEPKFLYVSKDLAHDSIAEISYFDMDWNKIPLIRDDYKELNNVDKPSCFDELVSYSRKLSSNFPFVRVDFYVINGKPVFSEMTFTPSAGMMPITPRHYDMDWGKLLDISNHLLTLQNKQ